MENRTEKIEPTGVFRLKVFNDCDELVEEYEDLNLVVNGGRNSIATLIGAATSGKRVTKISFGTNGSGAILGDTALTSPFTKAVGAVTYPATGKVQFAWSLELAEGNGMTIREYGLLSDDNTLFARKTRAEIAKTSSIRLEGTWTIQF